MRISQTCWVIVLAFIAIACNAVQEMQVVSPTVTAEISTSNTLTPAKIISVSLPTFTPTPESISTPTGLPVQEKVVSKEITDSNPIAFLSWYQTGSLKIVNLDGSKEKTLLDSADNFKWSPTGQWLGAVNKEGLWLVSPDGNKNIQLVDGILNSFTWSPDGKTIAYIQPVNEADFLYLVDVGSGNTSFLAEWNGAETEWRDRHSLIWSPDGEWIAAIVGYGIEIINLQSKQISRLQTTCQGGVVYRVLWSPKSDRLAIWDYGNGRYAHGTVCITTLEGQSYSLTAKDEHSSEPYWIPDGEGIYVGTLNFDPDDIDLDKAPRVLHFDDKGQLIEQIDLATEYQVYTLSLSPNGEFLSSLTDWKNGQIEIIDVKSPSSRRLLNPDQAQLSVGEDFIGYKWTSDNQHWAIASQDYSQPLRIFNIYSGELKALTGEYVIKHFAPFPIH